MAMANDGATEAPDRRLEVLWQRSDALFDLLSPEALLDQPIPLRQPFIFYLGHLPCFAWNQVRTLQRRPASHGVFDELFARGIDPTDTDSYPAQERWPAADAVVGYRDELRDRLRVAARAIDPGNPADRLALGTIAEHELMHQETLLYMVQCVPLERLRLPPPPRPVRSATATANDRIDVPAGRVRLGAEPGELEFGWDNEFPAVDREVAGFKIERLPVRHRDFLEFMDDGGFRRPELWTEASWAWRQRQDITHPPGWRRDGNRWVYRALLEELPLDQVADWPAYVSWAAADAFARWRGGRLPTEDEFHRAAYAGPGGPPREHPWGDDSPQSTHGNFGFRRWTPTPAGAHPAGASAWGVLELVGNGWEWTGTRFEPFPGFTPMPNYPGYSQDFFDGQHYVMLGASWATDDRLLRRSFRNWFQPHYPYVFAKFRCVFPA